jgi:hypothetical protein
MKYKIEKLGTYPQNGKHQYVEIDLPFRITKGEDMFYYYSEGEEKLYPSECEEWICFIKEKTSQSMINILSDMFEVQRNKDLNIILQYCKDVYLNALSLEIQRVKQM